MTELLMARARHVIAVEIDSTLARKLEERFAADARIEILQADILSTDLAGLCRRHASAHCFVFGNLPYYITSPIIHHLFGSASWIRGMALLVQREVAERIAAAPGTRAYGYLSVLAQLHSQPRIVITLPPGAFSPQPKVHSALVSFQTIRRFPEWDLQGQEKFLEFVKRCFAQKRKNLLNNLAKIHGRERVEQELAALAIPSNSRAEQLSLERFARLFDRLE